MARLGPRGAGWRLGWLETVFLGSLGLLALLQWSDLKPGLKLVVGTVAIVSGLLVLGRLAMLGMRRAIWRLRDRLLVTYLFIAVVPVVLTAFFAQLGAWALSSQVGVYLLNAELERRVGTIQSAAVSLSKAPAVMRAEALRRTGFVFRERYPGLEILIRDERGGELRFPQDSTLPPPPRDWTDSAGVLVRDSHFHAWAHVTSPVEVLMVTPITVVPARACAEPRRCDPTELPWRFQQATRAGAHLWQLARRSGTALGRNATGGQYIRPADQLWRDSPGRHLGGSERTGSGRARHADQDLGRFESAVQPEVVAGSAIAA